MADYCADTSDNVGINVDKEDLAINTNESEVIYKPTTMELTETHLWKQKFQSLEPAKLEVPKDSFKLYLVAFSANILPFCAAIGFSWTSPVLPKLMGSQNPLNAPVDASQASIIAAILCIGAAIGPFIYGYLADAIGRKKTLIAAAGTLAFAFLTLAFATDVRFYYFARFIQGIATGGNFCVMTMYIAEITENHNRGKFACYSGIFVAVGILYPFVIGPYLSVKVFCLWCTVPILLFTVLFTLVCPESPLYLTKIGDQPAAQKALLKLRYKKSKSEVVKEYQEMRLVTEKEKLQKGGARMLFSQKGPRNAMIVSATIFIFQQLCGINAVLSFMEDIFASSGGAIPPQYATVLVGTIQAITMYVTANLIERLGRKFLLLIALVGCSACTVLLGLYFYLKQHEFYVINYIWWLPIFSLILYIITFNLGLGPVPWTILSEIFPSNVKSFASAFVSAIAFAASFAVTLGFPIMNKYVGMATSFWIFGGCSILGFLFTYVVVPETKGMSLDEIQEYFSR